MFSYEDLNKVLGAVIALEEPEKMLRAWGIDSAGFERFIREGAMQSLSELDGMDTVERVSTEMMVGFFLGVQVARELEMRKISAEQEV